MVYLNYIYVQDSSMDLSLSPSSFLVRKVPYSAYTKLLVSHGSSGAPFNYSGYLGNVSIAPDNGGILDLVSMHTYSDIYHNLIGYCFKTLSIWRYLLYASTQDVTRFK